MYITLIFWDFERCSYFYLTKMLYIKLKDFKLINIAFNVTKLALFFLETPFYSYFWGLILRLLTLPILYLSFQWFHTQRGNELKNKSTGILCNNGDLKFDHWQSFRIKFVWVEKMCWLEILCWIYKTDSIKKAKYVIKAFSIGF